MKSTKRKAKLVDIFTLVHKNDTEGLAAELDKHPMKIREQDFNTGLSSKSYKSCGYTFCAGLLSETS